MYRGLWDLNKRRNVWSFITIQYTTIPLKHFVKVLINLNARRKIAYNCLHPLNWNLGGYNVVISLAVISNLLFYTISLSWVKQNLSPKFKKKFYRKGKPDFGVVSLHTYNLRMVCIRWVLNFVFKVLKLSCKHVNIVFFPFAVIITHNLFTL